MKRKGVLLLLTLLLMTLSGCGKEEKVGICFRQLDNYATYRLEERVSASCKQAGYLVETADATNDQARQNSQIRHFIQEEYDLLIVEPVMTAAAEEIAQQAKEANVPVIFLNYAPEESVLQSWDMLCYVGSDLSRPGALQAELTGKLPNGGDVNGDGTVAYTVISGPEDHVDASLWAQTCAQGLQGELLALDFGDWSRESARKSCKQRLAQYGKDIEVIFCTGDQLAFGALDAIKDGGRTVGKDVYLVTVGSERQTLLLVKSGDLTGTVSPDVEELAEAVAEAAEKLLRGKPAEKTVLLDFLPVTMENIEDFLP